MAGIHVAGCCCYCCSLSPGIASTGGFRSSILLFAQIGATVGNWLILRGIKSIWNKYLLIVIDINDTDSTST